MYDMHCHLDLMPSMKEIANQTLKNNINILTMTTTPKAYEKEINLLNNYKNIRVALGLHPQLVKERYRELEIVEKYIKSANYIGEIGLDFGRQYYSSKEKQVEVFDKIIYWSSLYGNKVISIHSVRADKMVIDILEKYRCTKNNICILHWFSGTITQLNRAVKLGCYFSINIKMINSQNGKKILERIPQDKILIESDAPFIYEVKNGNQLNEILNNTYMEIKDCYHIKLDEINKLSAIIFSKESYI
ncbi:Qat anti-phage system TatD family nuclease QatD [Clostridium tertium]|uniref:Qat anti-phage system TatD family nuclease QatD n=1 Tax=Clostridium tertium TaxID=1559 RepID=UPI00374F7AA8